VSFVIEGEDKHEEMKTRHTRKIRYFLVNSNSTKNINRQEIMILPTEREKVDFIKKYESEYAERMLKRMMETTQK